MATVHVSKLAAVLAVVAAFLGGNVVGNVVVLYPDETRAAVRAIGWFFAALVSWLWWSPIVLVPLALIIGGGVAWVLSARLHKKRWATSQTALWASRDA